MLNWGKGIFEKEVGMYEEPGWCIVIGSICVIIINLLAIIKNNFYISSGDHRIYLFFDHLLYILSLVIYCVVLVFGSIKSICRIVLKRTKKLPEFIYYNNNKLVEIHIGGKSKEDRKLFKIISYKALLYCIQNNRNVMFDTCFIKEKRVKSVFGSNVKVYDPNIVQKYLNYGFRFIFKPKRIKVCSKKYRRFVIYIDKLTNDERNFAKREILQQLKELN